MKLALECRTDMLEMVQPFADFDWILAHKIKEDEVYSDWYKESDKVKFVDSSVNELGEPLLLEEMKEAFDRVDGSYVVAPDFLGDAEKTIESYKECLKIFPKEQVVGVIQGETFTDAFECLKVYEKGMIAVPYDLCCQKDDPPWLMSLKRSLFISNIPNLGKRDLYIHLLGFTALDEFFWNHPSVLSMDTGIPVLLGLQGKDILDPLESKVDPTFNLMEKLELTQKGWTAIIRNIALLRRYL